MRDVVQAAYDACEVGATGWIRPDPKLGETIEGFQSAIIGAKVMQENRLIHIEMLHEESQSGHKMIDAIKFVKLK